MNYMDDKFREMIPIAVDLMEQAKDRILKPREWAFIGEILQVYADYLDELEPQATPYGKAMTDNNVNKIMEMLHAK